MQTKFYGASQSAKDRQTHRTAAKYALGNRVNDIHFYMTNGVSSDSINVCDPDSDQYNAFEEFYEKNGGLHEYASSLEYITPEDSVNREGYLNVCLDDTGKESIRFYFDPESADCRKIEYLYCEFNIGVSLTVTTEGWADWYADELVRAGIVQDEMNKSMAVAVN